MDFNVKRLAADAGTFLSRAVQVSFPDLFVEVVKFDKLAASLAGLLALARMLNYIICVCNREKSHYFHELGLLKCFV